MELYVLDLKTNVFERKFSDDYMCVIIKLIQFVLKYD